MADFQQIQSLTKGPNSQNGDNGSLPQNSATVLQEVNRYLIEKAVAERAKNVGLPYIDIEKFPINPDVLRLVAVEDAEKSLSVPFFKIGKKVRLAVYEPGRESFLSVLKRLQNDGYECELSLASDIGIRNALKLYTSGQLQVAQPVHNVVSLQDERLFEKELQNLIELKNKILKLPSEEALNELHVGAIRAGASDIHYQPEEKSCIVRFRIDGILHVVFELPNDIYHNFVNQLKYKSQMKLNVDNIPVRHLRISPCLDSWGRQWNTSKKPQI
ncbi:MAG: Type IV-A pilus assembly ATPase PilB [Candidatus Peregrinibacteria bacterium GW2011_GWA2_47_7]|nr:MAG: Type IV-A pilus assembly ATPase PilB [Candidatus Peregrinibacteria bacterium GW2011_GWA2_47_7]